MTSLITTTVLPNNLSKSQLKNIITGNNAHIMVLTAEIQKMTNEKTELLKIINGKDETIKTHENTIKLLTKTIEELQAENVRLNTKINELENGILNLKAEINNERLFNKLLYAIQDVNYNEHLESKFTYMKDVREDRVECAHYIFKDDPADGYKKKLLLEKLMAAQNNLKVSEWFSSEYSEMLIGDMIKYLSGAVKDGADLTSKQRQKCQNWWIR